MGRQPKIRVSYYNDAQFMLRLIHAIERDEARPLKWRQAMIAKLQIIASDFMNVPGGISQSKSA
jgi:hypothetical protein